MTTLTPSPIQHFVDNNGNALNGGKVFTYAAGTTTKINTYTDSSGSTPQTNPIILNARGEPENISGASLGLWLTAGTLYKFVLSPSTDTDPPTNAIWTLDNIAPPLSLTNSVYPVAFEFLGGSPPLTNEVMGMHTLNSNVNFLANFSGSNGYFQTAATGNLTATIKDQAGNSLGTMVVAASAHAPTFTTQGGAALSLTTGTTIIVTAPAGVDATLANGSWTLAGTPA